MNKNSKLRKKEKSTFKCPHCREKVRITSTKIITPTYKEFHGSCTNDECGGRYVFAGEPVRTLIQSQTPNPTVNIPLRKPKTKAS